MIADYSKLFAEHSTDGIMNEAQLITFTRACEAMADSQGLGIMPHPEENIKKGYANLNKWTAGVDGISMADYWTQQGLAEEIMNELDAEFAAAQAA